ncbi:MAG: MurR/RpiR family transcriptional regulator [Candidatus Pristimantibacillus lignocellulolyticus]|uniref:MurR/RpiR family transcriptional regulator n=1 Tax=Candidatus Pristimantibacillus lignocellulolyticus TaxID=2994561 RepID=A0A9J6ZLS7_9BACL|nr:MAG: MurR/RpiR family transcriptional regulator [Candidatus Pristimantibacillus lignocellulolyticus]
MLSLLQALKESGENLSPQEKNLVNFFLEQPREAVQMSITELAKLSGSSTSTISRFCRLFHAENFTEFKVKLAMELSEEPTTSTYQDIVAGQSLDHIVNAITANHIRSVSDTAKILDYSKLRETIDVLHHAKRIDIYGIATSGVVAEDFYQKLIRIGKAAAVFADPHMQQTSAASLGKGDVAIGFSYSGETPETIEALISAAEQGATTISVTKYGANTLSDIAEISLFISSSEAGMRRGDMASRMAQLHLVDILFVGLVSEYFDVYVPRLERSYQNVKRFIDKKGGY